MRIAVRDIARQAVLLAALALPSWAAPTATYTTYWGDLHGHTMESPVTLNTTIIDAYLRYARDTKGLHFAALTEKDFDLSDSEWSDCKARAAAFTTSSFIAFSAFEWGDGGYGSFGHRPVYYPTDDQPLFRSEQSNTDHISELLDAVSATTGFTSVAHPDLSQYRTDWDYFDGSIDRTAEIYSRHGYFETGDSGIQQALAQGYRFGIVAVSDSRTAQPGDYGLTAVLSSSFSKSALHAAIKARRTYATTGARILLQATMDGHQMGEEYSSSTGPTLSVTCTPTASLSSIEVLKNNVVVYRYTPAAAIAPPATGPWRRAPATLAGDTWTAATTSDAAWETTSLEEELEAGRRSGAVRRLRRTVRLAEARPGSIVRTNVQGEYRLYLNGTLLVDTHSFQYDDPNRPHDCDAPDAHGLAGTPESFRQLGFFDVDRLGGKLQPGDNVLAVEYTPQGSESENVELMLLPGTAASPVSFTWADGSFTSGAFYYLRVTQTDGHQAWSSPWFVDRSAPDTTPPQTPLRLRAHKDDDDVYLDWPKVTKDILGNLETISMYRIFRGTSADFVPDRSGRTNQIGTTTKKTYRDTGALNASTDYYYRVVAVDAAGNESPSGSNLAFMVHHPLHFHSGISNIYWMSLPYEAAFGTADVFARDLNRGTSGPVTKIVRWDIATQRPQSWVYLGGRWTGTNFAVSSGQALAVTIKQDMDALLVGAHDEGSTVRLTYAPGVPSLNWISLPVHTASQLAYQVVQDINGGYAPAIANRIVRFNPDLQVTQTYQWSGGSWSGTNFVILPGEAYGVEAVSTADWVPDTQPLP